MSIHTITMKKIYKADKYRFYGSILKPFKSGDIVVFHVSGKDIKTVVSLVSPDSLNPCMECVWHTDKPFRCRSVNMADLVMCVYTSGRTVYKQMTDVMEEL